MGSVKLGEFCGLLSAREKLPAYQSETVFHNTERQFFCLFFKLLFEITKNALPISFDRWPLATVKVVPLYWVCGRVAYPCVAFPCHIAKVCEKCVNSERIFLYEPC